VLTDLSLQALRPRTPLRHAAGYLGIPLQSRGNVRIAAGEVAFSPGPAEVAMKVA
jgi:hypothetical protein